MGSRQQLLPVGIIGREVSLHSTLGKSSKTNPGGRREIGKGEMIWTKQSIFMTSAWFIPFSSFAELLCLVAPGLWQHRSPLTAASAPCHLASLSWHAGTEGKSEVWRRKGAHIVRERTREMAPSLGAHPEGNSPKQRGQAIIMGWGESTLLLQVWKAVWPSNNGVQSILLCHGR